MVAFVFLDYINNQTNPQIVTHIRISRVVNGNFTCTTTNKTTSSPLLENAPLKITK